MASRIFPIVSSMKSISFSRLFSPPSSMRRMMSKLMPSRSERALLESVTGWLRASSLLTLVTVVLVTWFTSLSMSVF